MNTQIPKNVRQIGEIHPEHKIYMEDYVVTYFRQLSNKSSGLQKITLYGNSEQKDGEIYHFIYAAAVSENEYETSQRYFKDSKVVGWALIGESVKEDGLYTSLFRNQKNGSQKLLYFLNPETMEDKFQYLDNGAAVSLRGYYIYYDKNDLMQQFLIDWYEQNAVPSERMVRDRAAKSFRNTCNERQEEYQQKKVISLLYTASLMLLMLCCIAGVTMINQYEKMKSMERAIEHLALVMEEKKLPEQQTVIPENSATAAAMNVEEESVIETEDAYATEVAIEVMAGQGSTVYVVMEGDTLAKISKEHYGTSSKIVDICEMNQIQNPNNITVGQKILLP